MERFAVNMYIESTIKAPRRGEAKAMWLIEFTKAPEQIFTRQGFVEFGDITEDAVVLTAIAEGLSILTKQCEIRIFTRARHVFSTLKSSKNADLRCRKWLSASEKSIKNAPLWEIVTHMLEKHEWEITDDHHSFQKYMESELKRWQRASSKQKQTN